jgi:hypothetical protein
MRSGTMRTSAASRRRNDPSARAPCRFGVGLGSTPRVTALASSREAATPSVSAGSSSHGTQRGLRRRRFVRSAGRDRCAVEQTSRVSRDPVARTMLTRLLITQRFIRFRRCVQPCTAHAQPMWPPADAYRATRHCAGLRNHLGGVGRHPTQRRTGTTRRMKLLCQGPSWRDGGARSPIAVKGCRYAARCARALSGHP